MNYRPEIDGLRAVAVLPVILFHAGFESFAGGYVGVDVFFVISGYLITSIIRQDLQEGRFSLVRFYERRARRILPALFVVMLACIPFAWFWMMPDEFQDFAQGIVAVNLFASNILFWLKSGYFEPAAEFNPLLHTWSLAVEEQFYVIFPLLLLALARFRQRVTILLIGAVALISLGYAEYASTRFPEANFFLLTSRAWELAIGALIALVAHAPARLPHPLAEAGAGAGLLMIAIAVFAFDETVPFPGLWALLPVLGTALVIVCADPHTLTGRVLALRPVVGIGLISYSAYLWHQPLFAFARIRLFDDISHELYLGLAAASLLLAWITWRLVEQPFRNRTQIPRAAIFGSAASLAALLLASGYYAHLRIGMPERLSGEVARIAVETQRFPASWKQCDFYNRPRALDEACRYNIGNEHRVFIWGDSHGSMIAETLATELAPLGATVIDFTFSGCPPGQGFTRPGAFAGCGAFNDRVVVRAGQAEMKGAIFVLVGRWTALIERSRFDNGEGGVERGRRFDVTLTGSAAGDPAQAVAAAYRRGIEALEAAGARIVLVYPVPEAGWSVPERLARELIFSHERQAPLTTSHARFNERNAAAYAALDAAGTDNVVRVYPERLFCDAAIPQRCIQTDGETLLYADAHHLSQSGARLLSANIVNAIKQTGWLDE